MEFAKQTDMAEVTALWEECFGDKAEEIAGFFTAFSDCARVCIIREGRQIAGQLILLPVSLCVPGQNRIAAEYIYAVATKTACRRRGIATRLLLEVSALLKVEGSAGILVPADERLIQFYEERGFTRCFDGEVISVKADTGDGAELQAAEKTKLEEISASAYIALRSSAFTNIVHVEQPEEFIRYAVEQELISGGRCVRLTVNGREYGILYCVKKEEGILIREITAEEMEEASSVVKAFMKALGREKAVLQRSFVTCGTNLPPELIGQKEGYFNLVLD